jgi:hypothetical protein
MNTDLDTLLFESDPGHRTAIPSNGSPEFERIWAQISRGGEEVATPPHRRTRRILVPVISLGLAVAILLLIAVLWPTAGFRPSSSAAATLRSLAQVAENQPTMTPSSSQWLEQKVQVSFDASVLTVGATPTPNAVPTVSATINEWSNTKSTTCTESALSTAQFASPVNQQAWVAAGLLVNPTSPSVSCVFGSGPQSSALAGGYKWLRHLVPADGPNRTCSRCQKSNTLLAPPRLPVGRGRRQGRDKSIQYRNRCKGGIPR